MACAPAVVMGGLSFQSGHEREGGVAAEFFAFASQKWDKKCAAPAAYVRHFETATDSPPACLATAADAGHIVCAFAKVAADRSLLRRGAASGRLQ